MNRFLVFAIFCVISLRILSEDIRIEFSRIENERCTDVQDQNGLPCALIKVVTSQDLVFDVGILGVVKSEKTSTGYNLYVPEGIKRISISKQGLETLRNKDLGMSTQKGAVYSLLVKTSMDRIFQSVRIKVTPESAMVLVESMDADSQFGSQSFQDATGTITSRLPIGNYRYTAMAAGYQVEKGTFILTEESPRTIPIEMQKIQTAEKPSSASANSVPAGNTRTGNANAFKQNFGARLTLKDSYAVGLYRSTGHSKIVSVSSVTAGGAFDKAGVLNDFVIETVNGKQITSADEVQKLADESTLTIVGHYPKTKEIKAALAVKLGRNPDDSFFKAVTYTVTR